MAKIRQPNGRFRLPLGDATARLVFEDSIFEGAEVVVRTNLPIGVFMKIQELSASASLEGFTVFGDDVLVEWNLEDDRGEPIPSTGEGMKAITPAFATLVTDQWMKAVTDIESPLEQPSSGGNTLVKER
jgi:hypothetical protein